MCASARLILSGFCGEKKLSFIVTKNIIACKEKDKKYVESQFTAAKNEGATSKTNKQTPRAMQLKAEKMTQFYSLIFYLPMALHFTFFSLSIPFMSIVIKRFETKFEIFGSVFGAFFDSVQRIKYVLRFRLRSPLQRHKEIIFHLRFLGVCWTFGIWKWKTIERKSLTVSVQYQRD